MEKISDFSLGKKHKLKSDKTIKLLFSKGSSIFLHPIKIVYLIDGTNKDVPKVLFSVSKRNFKKSVDRHKIIRHLREAYRLEKEMLLTTPQISNLALVFVSKEQLDFFSLQKKLKLALKRLTDTFDTCLVSINKDS